MGLSSSKIQLVLGHHLDEQTVSVNDLRLDYSQFYFMTLMFYDVVCYFTVDVLCLILWGVNKISKSIQLYLL